MAADARHQNVGNDQFRHVGMDNVKGVLATCHCNHVMAPAFKHAAVQVAHDGFVIDKENGAAEHIYPERL
jgi:hypothetical protein